MYVRRLLFCSAAKYTHTLAKKLFNTHCIIAPIYIPSVTLTACVVAIFGFSDEYETTMTIIKYISGDVMAYEATIMYACTYIIMTNVHTITNTYIRDLQYSTF